MNGRQTQVSATTKAPPVMHEQVFEKIRDAIIEGQLAPGRKLSMRGLASEFDVSAMPAREAIRRLVAMGALELTNTRRVAVATMSEEKLADIKLARVALEPKLARRAYTAVSGKARAKKRLVDTLKKVDQELDRAIDNGDASEYARLNSIFHMTLYRSSRAPVLLGLVESLWLQFGPFMRIVVGRIGTSRVEDDQHKAAISAIEEDDADRLESAMRIDILEGMENIVGSDFERQ